MKRFNYLGRLSALVVLFAVGSLAALANNGGGTYYARVQTAVGAGKGTVYVKAGENQKMDGVTATSATDKKDIRSGNDTHVPFTILATPAIGYNFSNITDGSGNYSDANITYQAYTNSTDENAPYVTTVTANFTAKSYKVTFNANGGTIPENGNMGTPRDDGKETSLSPDKTSGTVKVTFDSRDFRTMSDDNPTREGYKFTGWFNGNVQVYDADGIGTGNYWAGDDGGWSHDGDVTLTAGWEELEKVNMTIGSAHYGTFCAPFNVEIPVGVTAYKETSDEGNYVKFSSIESVIPANTPVIVYSESTVNQNFYGTPITSDKICGAGVMKGNLGDDINATKGSYVLNSSSTEKLGVAFKVVGDTPRKVAKNRCYIPAPSSAKLNSLSIVIDETTAITDFSAIMTPEINAIYSISGAKLDKMQKGMNVVKYSDGSIKKIFVK